MAERGIVRVKVDIESVFVIQRVMLPPQLDVGDLQCVANGLDGIGAGTLGRPEYCYNTKRQLVTGWNEKGSSPSVTPRQKGRNNQRRSRKMLARVKGQFARLGSLQD